MRSEELVAEVVADLLDLDEDTLTPQTRLAEVEGWDSVNALRVLLYLERELGTALDFDAFERAGTLADVADLLNTRAGTGVDAGPDAGTTEGTAR